VFAPQVPQHTQAETLPLMWRVDFQHVDVQPIAQGIDTVIDVANAVATYLDFVLVVGTGKHKLSRGESCRRFTRHTNAAASFRVYTARLRKKACTGAKIDILHAWLK